MRGGGKSMDGSGEKDNRRGCRCTRVSYAGSGRPPSLPYTIRNSTHLGLVEITSLFDPFEIVPQLVDRISQRPDIPRTIVQKIEFRSRSGRGGGGGGPGWVGDRTGEREVVHC